MVFTQVAHGSLTIRMYQGHLSRGGRTAFVRYEERWPTGLPLACSFAEGRANG